MLVAFRTGKIATVTVRTADEDDVINEGVSPGTFSVLDLKPQTARFYIGGVPSTAGVSVGPVICVCSVSGRGYVQVLSSDTFMSAC